MKATINVTGCLVIEPETELEQFALMCWSDNSPFTCERCREKLNGNSHTISSIRINHFPEPAQERHP